MIRSLDEVRCIIDGTQGQTTNPPPSSRQRRQPGQRGRNNTFEPTSSISSNGNPWNERYNPDDSKFTPFVPQQRSGSHQPLSTVTEQPIRRGRTLGASSAKPITPPSSQSTTALCPALEELDGNYIAIVYRKANPSKKNPTWKADGFIKVNILTGNVSLMNANKFSIATCPISQFNLDQFNSEETMSMDDYEYMKS